MRRNVDDRLRNFEREAERGIAGALDRLLLERVRSGIISEERLQAAVWLGDSQAIRVAQALGLPSEPSPMIKARGNEWRQPVSSEIIRLLTLEETLCIVRELLHQLEFPETLLQITDLNFHLDKIKELGLEGLHNLASSVFEVYRNIYRVPGTTSYGTPIYTILIALISHQRGHLFDYAENIDIGIKDATHTFHYNEREPYRDWLRNRLARTLLGLRRNPSLENDSEISAPSDRKITFSRSNSTNLPEIPRSDRKPFLTIEEADAQINDLALPVYQNFRYRQSPYIMYRIGQANEFTEFTFDPNYYFLNTSRPAPAQMDGGRDTGLASGQYSFCTPQKGLPGISGPVNPFLVTAKSDDIPNPASDFARLLRTILRIATTIAGIHDYSESLRYGDYRVRNFDVDGMFWIAMKLRSNLNGKWSQSLESLQENILKSAIDWNMFRHVHPANILLSRYGFDGIWWGRRTMEYGDCGDFGCLKFPPITYMGEIVGLNPVPGSRIYMVLP